METRFNAYQKTLYDFVNNIYVVCPKCSKQAIVLSEEFSKKQIENEVRLSCPNCGHNKYRTEKLKFGRNSKSKSIIDLINDFHIGENIDPYFKLPLWLQYELRHGILWAYNYEHLEFIKNHVKADLRYRNTAGRDNFSIGARLPKWISHKNNRKEILAAIEKTKRLS